MDAPAQFPPPLPEVDTDEHTRLQVLDIFSEVSANLDTADDNLAMVESSLNTMAQSVKVISSSLTEYKVMVVESRQNGMTGDARPDVPQAVFLDSEPQPLFQCLRGLLEDQYLESLGNAAEVRRRTLGGQRRLADHQQVVLGKVCGGVHGLAVHAQRSHLFTGLAMRIK